MLKKADVLEVQTQVDKAVSDFDDQIFVFLLFLLKVLVLALKPWRIIIWNLMFLIFLYLFQ